MLHVLLSEPHDVLFDEQEVRLVSLDWIPQVIFFDYFFWISQIRRQNSNARCGLKVLSVIYFVKKLLNRGDDDFGSKIEHFQDS